MPDYKTKIKREEDTKLRMYKCSEDRWTIGTGHNIQDNGISQAVSDLILDEDLEVAINDAKAVISNFDDLSDTRKIVLVDMAFQMGKSRLSGFKKMIEAIEIEAWNVAVIEMLDSRYANQTPNRANRNATLMKKG
jgi:lysozyme